MSFYRALLRLYPRSFRVEYAAELERAYAIRQRGRGRFARTLSALADVVPNAASAHGELLRQDLAYAARSFGRTPGFAVTAVLVVALGVGANTAALTLADYTFLRPFPYQDADRLARVYQADGEDMWNYGDLSPGNWRDWKEQQRSFTALGAYSHRSANLVSEAEPRRVNLVAMTAEMFPLLGVRPIAGRFFSGDDTLTGQAIILSYGLWQTQFGGDQRIIGNYVRLDGQPHAVVGVMPASFRFPQSAVDGWVPLVFTPSSFEDRNDRYLFGIGRLRPGVTTEQARLDLNAIAARIAQQYGTQLSYRTASAVFTLRGEMSQGAASLIVALVGAALCILILACANLASLFLARGAHRAREMAVRSALGAGRERLVRQLITESLTLAALGGILGLGFAAAGVPLLSRLIPGGLPVDGQPTVDLRLLVVGIVLVLLTGLACGVAPAIKAARSGPLDALRGTSRAGGGRSRKIRAGLVILEIASSVVLLVGSGLLIRAVARVQAIDPGFRAENVLTMKTELPLPKYDSTTRRVQFYDRVLTGVRALPGVQAAGYVTGLPLVMRGGIRSIVVPGRTEPGNDRETASIRYVSSQYFATLRIPLVRGRDFDETDVPEGRQVAIVSEAFVQRYWPSEDPLGKRFLIDVATREERTIVGVVGDIRVRGLERNSEPQFYLPAAQPGNASVAGYMPKDLVVRASVPPMTLVSAIKGIIRNADAEQSVSNVRELASIVAEETAPRVTQLRILVVLSVIALLIAAVGIHGLLTFTVSARSHELGVRRALGAQVPGIIGLVLREGLLLAAAGIVIGIAVAWGAARTMGALLAGVQPEDPLTIGMAATLCFTIATLSCVRPAQRAARVDPLDALRSD
ncbi:MAG TPA: ABC transporter permease [Gemmatimonadaceae bacterium]